jgi:hypothetical protein
MTGPPPSDPTLEELQAVYNTLTEIALVLARIEKRLAQVDAGNKRIIARLEEKP